MIPASALHRLLDNIIDSAPIQGDFDNLTGFVGTYELDLQDAATLFRVASGEVHENEIDAATRLMEAKR